MIKVNIADIKARLFEYLDRALDGDRVLICRHNKPIAELRALEGPRLQLRPVGRPPGRPEFAVPASFFEPLAADELDLWEGVQSPVSAMSHSTARTPTRVREKRTSLGPLAKRRRPRRRS